LADYVDAGSDWATLSAKLIDLDYAAIAGLTEDAEGSLNQWIQLHAALHDCGCLMLDANGEIAGYWLHAPLCPNTMRKAKSGKLIDAKLSLENLHLLGPAGSFDMYLIAMVLHPRHQTILARNALIGSFMRHLEDLAELDIYIRDFCFCAYTVESERIAEGLELRRSVPHICFECLDPAGERRPAFIFEASNGDIARSQRIATHWPLLAKRYRDMVQSLQVEQGTEDSVAHAAGSVCPTCPLSFR
jgi:hypothetical protein